MNEQELLDALRQIVNPLNQKIEGIQAHLEKLDAQINTNSQDNQVHFQKLETESHETRVLFDTDIRQKINVLFEGHETILQRLPDPADAESLDIRVSAVETATRKHSNDIAA